MYQDLDLVALEDEFWTTKRIISAAIAASARSHRKFFQDSFAGYLT